MKIEELTQVTIHDLLVRATVAHARAYEGRVPVSFRLHPAVAASLFANQRFVYDITVSDEGVKRWRGVPILISPKFVYPVYVCLDGRIELI